MSGQVVDLRPQHRPPAQRRTQQDSEALDKIANVVAMVDEGYLSADPALPWLRVEVRRVRPWDGSSA